MIPIIPTPTGGTEIVADRVLHGKTFDMGGDKRRTVSKVALVHVPDDVPAWEGGGSFNWLDLDTDVELTGGVYKAKQVWHDSFVDPAVLGLDYLSKRSGDVRTRVTQINSVLLRNIPGLNITPRIAGGELWFDDVIPGLSIYFQFRGGGVATWRVLASSALSRPVRLEWNISRAAEQNVRILAETVGRDNYDKSNAGRNAGNRLNQSRAIEVDQSRTPDQTSAGRTEFFHDEELTGRSVFTDPSTRVKSWTSGIVFPIRMNGARAGRELPT